MPTEQIARSADGGQLLLFVFAVLLTALLGILYITLAEAPAAEAATVPIQTCSGISSYVTGPTSVTLPYAEVTVSKTLPRYTTTTVSRTIQVEVANPDYDPDDPDETDPPTIMEDQTESKTKQILTSIQVTQSGGSSFGTVNIGGPSVGASDTSSNLTTETTSMVPAYSSPGAGSWGTLPPPAQYPSVTAIHNIPQVTESTGFGAATFSHSGSASVTSGTRKSDGASASSSPANHYDRGTIEAWSWSGSWSVSVTASRPYYFTNFTVVPDTTWDGGPGTFSSFQDSATIASSASGGGTFGGCSRTLVVDPPSCTAKLRGHPDFPNWGSSSYSYATETFDPGVEHGSGSQAIRVFPVGPNARSSLVLRNVNNLFELSTSGSAYSYSGSSPYDSGRSPAAGGTGPLPAADDATMGSYLNGASWHSTVSGAIEPSNSINFPGKYRVTWTPSWSSAASSAGWAGSELSGSVCKYKSHPYANGAGVTDSEEGPQPRPADGTLVSSLTLNVYVFAEPPTCSVDAFLFEVNQPIAAKLTLTNPNAAPLWLTSADWTVARGGFTSSGSRTAGGNEVPAGGQLAVEAAIPPINHSGQFSLRWSLRANMGNETWTTPGSPRPPQRSWFEDPEERITDGGSACEVLSNKVVYRPFVKVFYGGLASGGQFGAGAAIDACGRSFAGALGGERPVSAFIAGHSEGGGPADARGASSEYALQAWGAIAGFYSASQRSSAPSPLKGLTLANSGGSSAFGGNWGKKSCLANWWREAEGLAVSPKPSPLELDLAFSAELAPNERRRFELSAGEVLELQASRPLGGLKASLFIDGDVLITEDIVNESPTDWYDPSEIGILSIIVRGNIDIAPSVARIDALLVAYPRFDAGSLSGGRLRTCFRAGLNSANHYAACNRRLTVNGALIAEKLLFGRVHASVRQETNFPATPSATRASEVINLLPEYLVGIPELPLFPDQIHKTESLAPRASNF